MPIPVYARLYRPIREGHSYSPSTHLARQEVPGSAWKLVVLAQRPSGQSIPRASSACKVFTLPCQSTPTSCRLAETAPTQNLLNSLSVTLVLRMPRASLCRRTVSTNSLSLSTWPSKEKSDGHGPIFRRNIYVLIHQGRTVPT